MVEAKSFIELGPRKDKFKSSSLKRREMVREAMRKMKMEMVAVGYNIIRSGCPTID